VYLTEYARSVEWLIPGRCIRVINTCLYAKFLRTNRLRESNADRDSILTLYIFGGKLCSPARLSVIFSVYSYRAQCHARLIDFTTSLPPSNCGSAAVVIVDRWNFFIIACAAKPIDPGDATARSELLALRLIRTSAATTILVGSSSEYTAEKR
jgi:hypothetical protein